MARARPVKPADPQLLALRVLRSERLSPHWMRVTLGEGDIDRFVPMGYDQWFRIFLPVHGEEGLERIPAKANKMLGYLRYLRIPDGMRPAMRSYTVRAFRPAGIDAGAELDIDFVLHGSGDEAGPASRWAESCRPGERVVLLDEGIWFDPARRVEQVLLAADETGVPAVAGICASLPATAHGIALIEAPESADTLDFPRPEGVEVRWLVRDGTDARLGSTALAALQTVPLPDDGEVHAFVAGEQALATGGRRVLVERGVSRDAITFTGYWRLGVTSPADATARAETDPPDAGASTDAGGV